MVWLLLAAGPATFLVAIVGWSFSFAARGVARDKIPGRVAARMPWILFVAQAAMAVALVFTPEARLRVAASMPPSTNSALVQLAAGGAAGLALAQLYLRWLAAILVRLQRAVGDYVPPAAVLPSVSRQLGVFFLANVLFAPLVEEALYRAYAIGNLSEQFGSGAAIAVSCVFFGLLHWAGGLWYMLATGALAGGPFAALFLWQGSLVAPVAAHLVLNGIEFLHVWRKRPG